MTTTTTHADGVATFDCSETVRRLWDYLDHELSEAERHAVDAHLADCERCPKHFAFEQAFLAALRTAREERGANAALRDRVRSLLGLGGSASDAEHGND